MQTTLTLQLDEHIIRDAQNYAKQHGKSVSQIVTEYLVLLRDQAEKKPQPLPPITQSYGGYCGALIRSVCQYCSCCFSGSHDAFCMFKANFRKFFGSSDMFQDSFEVANPFSPTYMFTIFGSNVP